MNDDAQSQKGGVTSLSTMEKDHIEVVFAEVVWNRGEASRQPGITVLALRGKIRKYGIVPPEE